MSRCVLGHMIEHSGIFGGVECDNFFFQTQIVMILGV